MAVVLFRVDERLIHGQVVVGWGSVVRPDVIVVVDDELAASPWEQELYTLGLPPQIEARFEPVAAARRHVETWRAGAPRVVVLTRDIATMRRLAEGGLLRGSDVNIGGIHHAPGRDAVLPYVFLSDAERRELRRLSDDGVSVTARDLPGARRVGVDTLLGGRTDREDA